MCVLQFLYVIQYVQCICVCGGHLNVYTNTAHIMRMYSNYESDQNQVYKTSNINLATNYRERVRYTHNTTASHRLRWLLLLVFDRRTDTQSFWWQDGHTYMCIEWYNKQLPNKSINRTNIFCMHAFTRPNKRMCVCKILNAYKCSRNTAHSPYMYIYIYNDKVAI